MHWGALSCFANCRIMSDYIPIIMVISIADTLRLRYETVAETMAQTWEILAMPASWWFQHRRLWLYVFNKIFIPKWLPALILLSSCSDPSPLAQTIVNLPGHKIHLRKLLASRLTHQLVLTSCQSTVTVCKVCEAAMVGVGMCPVDEALDLGTGVLKKSCLAWRISQ